MLCDEFSQPDHNEMSVQGWVKNIIAIDGFYKYWNFTLLNQQTFFWILAIWVGYHAKVMFTVG